MTEEDGERGRRNDAQAQTQDGASLPFDRSALVAGIERFNAHEFWHAHEEWETIWLAVDGEPRLFVQGLIQLAAAYHHVQRGTHRGALRLFDASLRKLSRYPQQYLGVDRAAAVDAAEAHRARVAKEKIDPGEYPKIRYN